ncbi:hypothetical protein E7Y32_07960 [Arthrobacter sp. UKPF54-2]|uniref:hypothetical protein n=1 Tax=Arthrobacter sp. UKPF54-2 TaxID=2600159 RepID=UPI0011B174E2|nr:hypothetical protein [Arthrobacter sp. UKPF54-2]QDY90150.1 hypothetical protein E7Y32_07960 [Arthrobacter sp. UKPF54-2]
MNEQSNGQLNAPSRNDATAGPAQAGGQAEQPRFTVDKPNAKNNEAVLGPFTVRDLTVFGSTLVLFIASLIPMFAIRYNLWNLGSLFFLGLGILLPLIVAALFVARRVSPGTKIRIGSLSVDQFASVVASFSLAFFFLAAAGAFVPSMLLGLLGALGLFTATVLARLIPVLAGDFLHRAETPAHVVAREAAEPVRKPRAPKAPKAPKAAGEAAAAKQGTSPLAGWAKKIVPGKQADGSEHAARGHETHGASTAAAAGAAGIAAGAAAGAAAAHGRPAAEEPATQAHGVVPAASPTPTAAYTPAAPAAPAAASHPAADAEPSAAEQTQAAAAPNAPAAQGAPAVQGAPAEQRAGLEETQAAAVPAAAAPAAAGHEAPTALTPQVRSQEPIGATVDPASRPAAQQPAYEAFWFAVAQPRTAVDEHTGAPAFVVEPGGWVLALEDRGHEFLVQHTDGRVGVLRDLSNIERG